MPSARAAALERGRRGGSPGRPASSTDSSGGAARSGSTRVRTLIGRDREAVVWIDDESVSRRHARISISEEGATIEDLGSKNGTYVDEKRIRARTPLTDRDVVKIGPATLTLRVLRRTGSTRSTMRERSPR